MGDKDKSSADPAPPARPPVPLRRYNPKPNLVFRKAQTSTTSSESSSSQKSTETTAVFESPDSLASTSSHTSTEGVSLQIAAASGGSADVAVEGAVAVTERSKQARDEYGETSTKCIVKKTSILLRHEVAKITYIDVDSKEGEEPLKGVFYFPLPDGQASYEFGTQVAVKGTYTRRTITINGFQFNYFYDENNEINLSLPVFKNIISRARGTSSPKLPKVGETATVRISAVYGGKCYVQARPFYVDMIGYLLFTAYNAAGNTALKCVRDPLPGTLYVYINFEQKQYLRVMIQEKSESSSEDSGKKVIKNTGHSEENKSYSVICVDYGMEIKAEGSKIYNFKDLYPELESVPRQAKEVTVSSVGDSSRHISFLLKRLGTSMVRIKTVEETDAAEPDSKQLTSVAVFEIPGDNPELYERVALQFL